MKNIPKILLLFLSLSFIFASCKKDNANSTTEQDKLPPATQTGANTFGCLVNGKVYIPKGYSGTGAPNPKTTYDIGLNGLPNILINANQYEQNIQTGSFIMFIDSITSNGMNPINTNGKQIGFGSTVFPNCGNLRSDTTQFKTGFINITKYDIPKGIISGVFNFKIKPNNCDTLFFTDGRFDFKL